MRARPVIAILAIVLSLATLACGERERREPARTHAAASFRGTVISIHDGDTLTLLDAERVEQRIRLAGIDAPERGQPFGRDARESLASIALGRVADVAWTTRDRYGRIVGKVMLPDPACPTRECPNSVDAGLAQVSRGSAWWYRRYAGEQSPADRRAYESAEQEARDERRGLWSEPVPVPPWDWRDETRLR